MNTGYFVLTAAVVIVTPGPDAALLLRLVLLHRRRSTAMAAAAGMITAGTVHATLSILGVALVLRDNPESFAVLRWIGATALVWWGVLSIRDAVRGSGSLGPTTPPPAHQTYVEGFLCTGTNPKIALFFLAFLPQFVPAGADPIRIMAMFASLHLLMAAIWLMVLTELILQVRRRVVGDGILRHAQMVTGFLFFGLACHLALA
jgi:threonine/homoserine/homoserine lactone efflux protein